VPQVENLKSTKGHNSDKFYARVENLVTYDVMWLMTRNLYLKFEENILRNKELIVKKR
jgi:hypothetical protein